MYRINIKNNPNPIIAKGIHNGAKTHNQDHVITLQSFNTISAIASNVGKLPNLITISFAILSITFICPTFHHVIILVYFSIFYDVFIFI